MKRLLTLILLAGGLAVSPAVAQQHDHAADGTKQPATRDSMRMMMHQKAGMHASMMSGMPGMMGGSMGMLMNAMRFTPSNLLERRTDLALTPAQVARLDRLGSMRGMSSETMAAMPMSDEGKRLREAFEATDPDTAAIRSLVRSMMANHADMHAEMVATAALARSVLTAEQRASAAAMEPACPMMQQHDGGQGHMKGESN